MTAGKGLGLALGAAASLAMVATLARAQAAGPGGRLFVASGTCLSCHNGISSRAGEDISIGFAWRPTMMANSARDPYWQAGVRRELLDHPRAAATIENECSICHMPMATAEARAKGRSGVIFAQLQAAQPTARTPQAALAIDGVSCALCHQIESEKLGTRASLVGGFVVDKTRPWGSRRAYGPFTIGAGRTRIMRSATQMQPTPGSHLRSSEVCATCHTLITEAFDDAGKIVGALPEQVPYQEWYHSAYRQTRSCQSCHMPEVTEPSRMASVLGELHPGIRQHSFLGGNFLVPRLLARYSAELGVAALPQELTLAAELTREHLESSSGRLSMLCSRSGAGRIEAEVTVSNLTGHKLPTAYPSRRVWLHVRMLDQEHRVVFESGALSREGAIVGNDNDADPGRYEPHYLRITRPEQVQIYESIMGKPNGAVTTGLLSATRYLKDNRLLPQGFDPASASPDIAVHGQASLDPDFRGGSDTARYSVEVSPVRGPFEVVAELWYQPIGYRWAENLAPYSALEPQRFLGYYRATSRWSAVMLARTSCQASAPNKH